MYKYESGEYVYYMDVNSFGDNCTRLYKDTTDGSYVVLELDYSYTTGYDDNDELTEEYYSNNEVYFVDVDTQKSYIFKTIKGGDITSISKRTFYNEDNTELIAAYNYYLDNLK